MRKDLYDILLKFHESNSETLDRESKRYVERCLIEGKQDGIRYFNWILGKLKLLKAF